jgi:membrane associated rhomboid family serine protease
MIPISDDNPTLRTPLVTMGILALLGVAWFYLQGMGLDPAVLAASVCNLGLVPAELTGAAPVGTYVQLGPRMACVVDAEPINWLTPITSMFLHGGWGHLLGNGLFLWVFGNNVEDSMGRFRFILFYLLCGLAAAGAQVMVAPESAIPMVGASGAISGVMGAYLILYPRVRVNVLFIIIIFIKVIPLPAYLVLLWWIAWQVIGGLPQFLAIERAGGGVAFAAHVGGFLAGVLLVKLFENRERVHTREALRHRLHPDHP